MRSWQKLVAVGATCGGIGGFFGYNWSDFRHRLRYKITIEAASNLVYKPFFPDGSYISHIAF